VVGAEDSLGVGQGFSYRRIAWSSLPADS